MATPELIVGCILFVTLALVAIPAKIWMAPDLPTYDSESKSSKIGCCLALVILIGGGFCSFMDLEFLQQDSFSCLCRILAFCICVILNVVSIRWLGRIRSWIEKKDPRYQLADRYSLGVGFALTIFTLFTPVKTLSRGLMSMTFVVWTWLLELSVNVSSKHYLSVVSTLISTAYMEEVAKKNGLFIIGAFVPSVFFILLMAIKASFRGPAMDQQKDAEIERLKGDIQRLKGEIQSLKGRLQRFGDSIVDIDIDS